MSVILHNDWGLSIREGKINRYKTVNKYGHSDNIGTSFLPVTSLNVYKTPTTATSLEILSSDANDTSAGSGARTVVVEGIDENWDFITETVSLSGVTPVALVNTYLRIHRAYVLTTGTYATNGTGSHVGTILIREAGAGASWIEIDATTGYPFGTSEVACYTIPRNEIGYIASYDFHVSSTKNVDFVIFAREQADIVTAPYGSQRILIQNNGVVAEANKDYKIPLGPLQGPCDVGIMARVGTGTGDAGAEFELIVYEQ